MNETPAEEVLAAFAEGFERGVQHAIDTFTSADHRRIAFLEEQLRIAQAAAVQTIRTIDGLQAEVARLHKLVAN
jgi:hypothetical protein